MDTLALFAHHLPHEVVPSVTGSSFSLAVLAGVIACIAVIAIGLHMSRQKKSRSQRMEASDRKNRKQEGESDRD